jgi:hypothetical protein
MSKKKSRRNNKMCLVHKWKRRTFLHRECVKCEKKEIYSGNPFDGGTFHKWIGTNEQWEQIIEDKLFLEKSIMNGSLCNWVHPERKEKYWWIDKEIDNKQEKFYNVY